MHGRENFQTYILNNRCVMSGITQQVKFHCVAGAGEMATIYTCIDFMAVPLRCTVMTFDNMA